jgi:hypothetical protein
MGEHVIFGPQVEGSAHRFPVALAEERLDIDREVRRLLTVFWDGDLLGDPGLQRSAELRTVIGDVTVRGIAAHASNDCAVGWRHAGPGECACELRP